MSELIPCPFCGGEAELCYSEVDTFCRKCNVMQETELWNNRPIEDALTARIAELEAEIERLTVHSDIERQDDKWIPVSERLPEMNVRVLIASSGYVSTDFLCVKTYPRFRFEGSVYPVTHWMPLPEPPEVK